MALKRDLFNDFSGGVNSTGQPLNVGKGDMIACQNMYPVHSGYLIGRGGQSNFNSSAIDANPIKSLYRFYKQDGTGIMLATSGTKVYTIHNTTGAATEILSGLTSGKKHSFVTWTAKDAVYWVNNADVAKKYDGTTVSTLGGTPPTGSQIELYLDRLYILTANAVRFSDLNVDNVWQAAASLNISDKQGGTEAFLKATGDVLIAGKTSGLWRLEGSPLLGNVFRPYSDVGCIAPWSAVTVTTMVNGQIIPAGVVFCGRDGVYLTDGYNTHLISGKINPVFKPVPSTLTYFRNAVGHYYPKLRQYWLSFDNAGGANDQVWVATNIDAPSSGVAWTEYTGFALESFAVWDGGSDNGEFFGGSSADGRIKKLDVTAQDAGTNYTCTFTTPYFGSPFENSQVRWLKPVFDANGVVHYQIDYFQRQISTGSIAAEAPLGVWDSGTWDSGVWGGVTYNSARTSDLSYKYGRYYNVKVHNTGDGPNFKFFSLAIQSRVKDPRVHNVFTLNMTP